MAWPGRLAGVTLFEPFGQPVDELTTTEGRLATTGVVVVVGFLVAFVAFPVVLRAVARVVRSLLPDGVVEILDVMNAALPTTVTGLTLRAGQFTVVGTVGVTLLATWGMVDTAVTVLSVTWRSLPFAGQLTVTLVVLAVAYVAADSVESGVREFGDGTERITPHQEEVMLRVGHLGIMLVVAAGLFTLWGFDLSGLLVGAGALSIVVGLAARKTLGSAFAGFVLMFSRPFTVGDWVELGEHEGVVTHLTIMHTKLREFDGKQVIIPNDVVGERSIRNLSYQDVLRLQTEVGVAYDADPAHAEQVALDAIAGIDGVLEGPPPQASATAFGDSAVRLTLLYWIDDPNPLDARRAREAVVHSVKQRFESEGIGMPFPHRTLSGQVDTGRVVPEATPEPGADRTD